MINEFKFQPSQWKTIVTVQNEKSVPPYYHTDLLLAGWSNKYWGESLVNNTSHLNRKLCFSITIATNGPIVR